MPAHTQIHAVISDTTSVQNGTLEGRKVKVSMCIGFNVLRATCHTVRLWEDSLGIQMVVDKKIQLYICQSVFQNAHTYICTYIHTHTLTYILTYIHTDVFVCVIGSDGEKERRHVRTYEDFVAYTYVCTIILLLLYIHMY